MFGEGIYSTRPWRRCQEGETCIKSGGEEQADWKTSDVRYTSKNGNVYAFLMKADPGETVVLTSFDRGRVKRVTLNGRGELPFVHELNTLLVRLPEKLPTGYINMLTVSGDDL